MFRERMVTTAIPERVYTLCKIVEKKPISNSELKEKMEPSYLNQTSSYFNDYRTAAEELKLISVSDNMIYLAVESSIIKNMDSMRRYINSILEDFQNGQFYLVTRAYFELDSNVLNGDNNLANLAPSMSQRINQDVDAMAMRAWRFWFSFLGFGYLQEKKGTNMFMIPNASEFLKDVINIVGFEKNYRYSFSDFISKILPYSRMIINADPASRQLNFGVSNGLRSLHDLGIIKMEHILDQEDIWNLYPLKAHEISGTVTNITICGLEIGYEF